MTAALRAGEGATLTWPHLRFALFAGLGFGGVAGISNAMFAIDQPWNMLAASIVVNVAVALLLLPCLAVTGSRALQRLPAWLRYGVAGFVASVVAVLAAMTVLSRVLHIDAPTLRAYWVLLPPVVMTGVFAALGYMQWLEARRRANALHNVKMDRARVAREAYEARLVALQARVEPAFLFDTLSTVRALYDRDEAQGAKVLDDLIVHLRAALPTTEVASSSLMVELALVRTWLDIARVRSGGRLVVAMPGSEAPPDARMPPMVLLPLVQHAVAAAGDESCAIVVSAGFDGHRVSVRVIGPLAAFAARRDAPEIAAARERFAALYGDSGTLTLQSVACDRSQAVLEVPYEHSDRQPR